RSGDVLTFRCHDSYTAPPGTDVGNALRWAELFNFGFTANVAPTTGNATIGYYKPGNAGDPTGLAVAGIPIPTVPPHCGSADFNHDGDVGTDLDIEAFFACLGRSCCAACDTADFNGDGDTGTDADIESFFRVIAGAPC